MLRSTRPAQAKPTTGKVAALPDNDARYAAGLELEKRLYESALSDLQQTFTKEGIVAAFLTSGVIIGLAACLQAFATIAPLIGRRAAWTSTTCFLLATCVLAIGAYRMAQVLRGRDVKDLSEATAFLNDDPQPATKDDVSLKLMAEYRQARLNHEALVNQRLKTLYGALWWLGGSVALSIAATLGGLLSLSIHREPQKPSHQAPNAASQPTYNLNMADKPTPKPIPPVVLPKPGPGTSMTKGGGGKPK